HPAGRKQARCRNEPLVYSRAVARIGTAGVAKRRETAIEAAAECTGHVKREIFRSLPADAAQIQFGNPGMRVQVDEAGHQRAAGEIDALSGTSETAVRYLFDRAALDDDGRTLHRFSRDAVENTRILEND